ncbi:Os01g0935350 [Oryza sativa Japonica Group]|uniref:Os01g0935350 protein n=1 Tax=Oryza sativa subsp. japonica TaxID=39947 RepID=A0A0P0VCM9_ORYSJ|nr:hypothetical protein EE612_007826 [Oryza sativa]BAS76086.1 Os01g0935350 [Oryza sativa Japonica Group]
MLANATLLLHVTERIVVQAIVNCQATASVQKIILYIYLVCLKQNLTTNMFLFRIVFISLHQWSTNSLLQNRQSIRNNSISEVTLPHYVVLLK